MRRTTISVNKAVFHLFIFVVVLLPHLLLAGHGGDGKEFGTHRPPYLEVVGRNLPLVCARDIRQ
jgi:hypothetical protein